MPFTISPILIAAVEEVAEKNRNTSRAGEETIQNAASQLVTGAYKDALRHHHNNRLLQIRGEHRESLIYFFTSSGVSQTTAERIVDADILCEA